MKILYAVIMMILAIGIFASFSGIVPEPTGASVSDVFKIGLLVNDNISIYSYEAYGKKNMTALDVLGEKFTYQTKEEEGRKILTAILTSEWVMNNNNSEWKFYVNGEEPEKDGVIISPAKFYVYNGVNLSFVYSPKNT